jgi:hypothetical protein
MIMASHVQCIYRRPHECKERHKFLTDKSSGDGADSADDSSSSQHYPPTLPGVPKVSSNTLFYCILHLSLYMALFKAVIWLA